MSGSPILGADSAVIGVLKLQPREQHPLCTPMAAPRAVLVRHLAAHGARWSNPPTTTEPAMTAGTASVCAKVRRATRTSSSRSNSYGTAPTRVDTSLTMMREEVARLTSAHSRGRLSRACLMLQPHRICRTDARRFVRPLVHGGRHARYAVTLFPERVADAVIAAICARRAPSNTSLTIRKSVARQIAHAREDAIRHRVAGGQTSIFVDDGTPG